MPARSESDLRFLPTTYTACLLDSALRHVAQRPARSGFEVGVGGGYVMAALLQAGVERFEGVDILPDAVVSARRLLEGLGLAHRAEVNEGDLWSACEHRRFDLIVANLPQFPLKSPLEEEHPPSWSNGGPDGRLLIEPFIEGLPLHLEPGGTSLMTHNLFIDLPRTLRLLNSTGLIVREVARNLVPLSAQRVQQLRAGLGTWNNDDDLCAAHGLTCVGPQVFAAFAVLEIRKPPVEHG